MSYSFIKLLPLLTLFDVNASFISKIILTASLKSLLCFITALSNLYSLEILSLNLLFLIFLFALLMIQSDQLFQTNYLIVLSRSNICLFTLIVTLIITFMVTFIITFIITFTFIFSIIITFIYSFIFSATITFIYSFIKNYF